MGTKYLPNSFPFGAIIVAMATVAGAASGQSNSGTPAKDGTVGVRMHNVMYHFTPQVAVHIQDLQGELAPAVKDGLPIFDDKDSFILRITDANIAISSTSMANVLNSHVFARNDAPLKNISITIEDGKLKVKGSLHGHGDIPFETDGTLSATDDGKIRLHAEKIKALHLPVKGFMDLFGIEIADLIKSGKVRGVKAEKDDLILDPQEILPPPHIQGKVHEVHLQGSSIVQIFGTGKATQVPELAGQNYMSYRGNRLQFGKLTMRDTDMDLIDMDAKDPFDFYLDHYQEQLSAGFTKITPKFGLRVYMRDFNKLPRPAKPTSQTAGRKP
jgi:hypothetical protein